MPEIVPLASFLAAIEKVAPDPSFFNVTLPEQITNTPPHVYGLLTKNLATRVQQYFNDTLSVLPACDQKVFADNRLRQNEAQSVLEGAVNGNPTFINELFVACSEWGFELKHIHTPLSFWHGMLDPYVSWQASEQLAAQCTNAKLKLVEDAGQYLIYSHWPQLLDEVVGLDASGVRWKS